MLCSFYRWYTFVDDCDAIDGLVSIAFSFLRGADHSISSTVTTDGIQCVQLSCEEKVMKDKWITQFLWSEHYLCRRVGSFGVLFTDLSTPDSQTLLLQNNQLALTRAFQSLLNTASRVLAIANRNELVYFLYDSMELQVFDTHSKSWTQSLRLPLCLLSPPVIHRPDSFHPASPIENAVMCLFDDSLIVSINSGCESNNFTLLYQLSPLSLISIIPLPTAFSVPIRFPSYSLDGGSPQSLFLSRTVAFRLCPSYHNLGLFRPGLQLHISVVFVV